MCVCIEKNINKIWEWPCPLFLEHRLSTLYAYALTRGITCVYAHVCVWGVWSGGESLSECCIIRLIKSSFVLV